MTAQLHLVSSWPAQTATDQLLGRFAALRSPGQALWLAPSQLAVEEVVRTLVRDYQVRLAPLVRSLPSLVRQQWCLPRLSQQRLLLAQIADKLHAQGQLTYFRHVRLTRGFTESALRLFEELMDAGVSPSHWQHVAQRHDKWLECVRLYEAWLSFATPTHKLRARELQHVRTLFLAGFTTFTPCEWQLIDQLARSASAVYMALPWDDDPTRGTVFEPTNRTLQDLKRRFQRPSAQVQGPPSRPHRTTSTEARPAGLAHLVHHLFRRAAPLGQDATGVSVLAAPGDLGEARMVARAIRTRINAGTPVAQIVVASRDLSSNADRLRDVFAEYGVPTQLVSAEVLAHVPVVATLLRAAQLAKHDWPFADVTALLRSSYFQPTWPECTPERVQHAEILLRLLGEPRHRQAYLRAVDMWADNPDRGLEDEQAEESRRQRTTQFAQECRPFLRRFFASWDHLPTHATPHDFGDWLQGFANDLGITTSIATDERATAALALLWKALAAWEVIDPITREAFFEGLTTIAASEVLPRVDDNGGVRLVPAHEARYFHATDLYLMGLGEGSFPRLTAPDSLIDDVDRAQLCDAGLPLADPKVRPHDEQLLFLQLVATPRERLILSYPAVDDKGQPLLPGTFLRAVLDAFASGVLTPHHQRMLLDGYYTQEPLSLAEARVQVAAALVGKLDQQMPGLPDDLAAQLRLAHTIAEARFAARDFNAYDGWLRESEAHDIITTRFGPTKVFSPTALESYVACPFRFYLEHVLRLEELAEPSDDVEQTRRGSAYHRALARFHNQHHDDPTWTQSTVPEEVTPELQAQLDTAIAEYIDRAPSPATKVLWQLERRRLERTVPHYRQHWEDYLAPWRARGVHLTPHWLETDFGLPGTSTHAATALQIDIQGVRVQIGGRIDRVDVAEIADGLGFWIIDYKTGNSSFYTARGVQQLEKMQLPLYALAVEKVLSHERPARPLGLAYWLVTDSGPKSVLPSVGRNKPPTAWLDDAQQWATFRAQLEAWVTKIVTHIRAGEFPLAPRSDECTKFCPYSRVCRITQSRHVGKRWDFTAPTATKAEE